MMETGRRVHTAIGWKKAFRIGKGFLICGAAAMLAGCAERKAHAIPWATAVLVRPNPPVPQNINADGAEDIAPDFRIEVPSAYRKIFAMRPVPAPGRPPGGQNSTPAENGTESNSPLLVPELSPHETAVAKVQTSQSVAVAERNLAAARKKNLTPMQLDAVSKINGFLTEAREASHEGDWARARNLAKKAQILSEDLVAAL